MEPKRRPNALPWLLMALLLVGGALLRAFGLGDNPPGLWQDEASTGVDAYLLWTTGRDRAGVLLPVIARSFGDYPLTLYRYLTAPIVGLFGLTVAHQRWVACCGGVSLLLSTFVFVRLTLGMRAALCALLSAALTPTWIHFSRYGSEAILLPATMMGAMALFEWGRSARRWGALWMGAFVLASAAYTYHAVKLFMPLWMIVFLWYQWPFIRQLWTERRRHLVGPALLFVACVLPSAIAAFTPEGMARGNTVAAWKHYQGVEIIRVIAHNYLAYFEPTMLFIDGGPAVAQSIPGVGIWSAIDLPLIVAGLVVASRLFREHRVYGLLVAWFLLGPLPGGITYEAHNIGRVIGWLPVPQILSGLGMAAILGWVRQTWAGRRPIPSIAALVVATLLVAGWTATATTITRLTLVRYPQVTERDWQFEVTRALLCAKRLRVDRRIVISPSFPAAEIFALFHLSDLPKDPEGKRPWTIAQRSTIGADELYAIASQDRRPPRSEIVCEVRQTSSGEIKALVLATPPPLEAGPVIDDPRGPLKSATAVMRAPQLVRTSSATPPTKGGPPAPP